MSGDRELERAEALARQALGLREEEREAFLEAACRDDPELRSRTDAALGDLENPDEEATLLQGPEADLPTAAMPAVGVTRDPYRLAGTRVGHYEIQERLGKGGMGVVYRARDTRLDRTVALKFLLLSLSDEPAARERFFAEARSASALDHNNICTIHEFGETEDGKVYIVMAYYEGETLAAKMLGKLSIEAALDYGIQIASGLAAAHAKGILHRDIKPANVMVTDPGPGTERGTAKILDFGLAKIEGNDLTRSGTTMGTVAYMSPEQACGEKLDQRTDIWSLGVILYQALTGQRPFEGKTEAAVLSACLHADPIPLRQLDPEIPAELEKVVLRCLEKDKEKRYSRMDDLLTALQGFFMVTGTHSLSGVRESAAVESPKAVKLRVAIAVLSTILALLALALVVPATRQALLRPLVGASAPAASLVAVLPFINSLGTTPENQALTDGLTLSVTSLVARLGTVQDSLWVVPANDILQQTVTTSSDARRLFGVDTVLTGSVQRIGSTTEIILSVIDPTQQPPRTIDSVTLAAPLSPSLRERALDGLADLLGVESEVRSSLSTDSGGGTSIEVYTLYLQGLGFLQRYDQAGALESAIRVFGEALEGDDYYGPAHAGLCEALWQRYNQTDDASLPARAVASCERAAELASGQAPVLVTVGRSYLEMGDNRRAKAELERALDIEPANANAYRWLGWAEFLDGRTGEAEAAFRKAIDLNPRLWLYYNDLGQVLYQAGRFEDALEVFEESRRLTPENYLVYNAVAVALDELNQVDASVEQFRRSIELQPNPMAYRNLGYMSFRERRYEQAVEDLENARDLLEESPSFNDWPLWGWLANAYYWAGDRTAAEETWARVIEVATPLYEVNPEDADALIWLSDAHIALGNADRGRFYQGRLLALPVEAARVKYYIGRNYERLGDRELALSYVRQALEARFDPRFVDGDPWLEELRTTPQYQALRQQYLTSSG